MHVNLRRVAALLLGLVVVGAVYALCSGGTSSPEEQVREAIRDMERGFAERDVGRVLDHVSNAFHSPMLGDKADVRRIVLAEVLRSGGIHLVTLKSTVVPEEGRLRWQGTVGAARIGGRGAGPELQPYAVEALFAKEGGQWLVVEATVQPID